LDCKHAIVFLFLSAAGTLHLCTASEGDGPAGRGAKEIVNPHCLLATGFSQAQYTFAQLLKDTDKPIVWLKEVLTVSVCAHWDWCMQAHYTFSQLLKETDQPVVWLKEVLATVAQLHKRGPLNGLWELKREYRHGGTAENPNPV
jgi:hypothetical protein